MNRELMFTPARASFLVSLASSPGRSAMETTMTSRSSNSNCAALKALRALLASSVIMCTIGLPPPMSVAIPRMLTAFRASASATRAISPGRSCIYTSNCL